MDSLTKRVGPLNYETTVRLLLLANDSVALALSFACMQALFFVLGSIFAVSILFNLSVLLANARRRRVRVRLDMDNEEKKCPSFVVMGMDFLGVLAFLSLYVCSTIETANNNGWRWDRAPTLLMAYASFGTLVAFAMHGFLAFRNLHQFYQYRQSLGARCPHCHQELGLATRIALPQSPIQQGEPSTGPRDSLSANSTGENEADMLILKT